MSLRRLHASVVAVSLLCGVSCVGSRSSSEAGPAVVRPLAKSDQGAPSTAPTTSSSAAPSPSVTAAVGDTAPVSTDDASTDTTTTHASVLVDELLLRYDTLVTRLADDPATMIDPTNATRLEWNQLVPADTALSADVLEQLVVDPVAEQTRLVPAPDGFSYRHRSLSVAEQVGDIIEFTWCGYSPGVRVDARSATVLDDAVAFVHGSGRLQLDPTGWTIDALDHLSLEVHAPGSADPCPAEQSAQSDGSGR